MSELYEDPSDDSLIPTPQTVLVISNFPSADAARSVASTVVSQKLAACANVMSPCHSVYAWDGKLQEEMEIPVWFKTTDQAAPQLMDKLKELHPHDLPEVITLRPQDVQADYAQWVRREVG